MKNVISWNVNSIRIRYPMVQSLIRQYKPDVLMLQELKCTDDKFPHEAFPDYTCYTLGQASYNGVAIMVKKHLKPELIEAVKLCDNARCIKMKLGTTYFMCVYVPCGAGTEDKLDYKRCFLKALSQAISSLDTDKLIVGGDFNVARTDIDVEYPELYRDSVLCLPDLRVLLADLIETNKLDDPNENKSGKYTWWDYRSPNKGVRIDYIFTRGFRGTTSQLADFRRMKITTFVKDGKKEIIKPSDHAPVLLELQ